MEVLTAFQAINHSYGAF